jgi:hypothetical protein
MNKVMDLSEKSILSADPATAGLLRSVIYGSVSELELDYQIRALRIQ